MSTALVRNTLLAACLALPMTACMNPLAPHWDDLERAQRLWSGTAPAHYSFTYTELCFCVLVALDIEVLNGEVVSVEPSDPEEQPPPGDHAVGYTIDELLERVAHELGRGPHDARTQFDPTRGFPIEVFFDYEQNVSDEEWGFRVESFTVLP